MGKWREGLQEGCHIKGVEGECTGNQRWGVLVEGDIENANATVVVDDKNEIVEFGRHFAAGKIGAQFQCADCLAGTNIGARPFECASYRRCLEVQFAIGEARRRQVDLPIELEIERGRGNDRFDRCAAASQKQEW